MRSGNAESLKGGQAKGWSLFRGLADRGLGWMEGSESTADDEVHIGKHRSVFLGRRSGDEVGRQNMTGLGGENGGSGGVIEAEGASEQAR